MEKNKLMARGIARAEDGGRMVCRLIGRLIGRMEGRLEGRLEERLEGRLVPCRGEVFFKLKV